MGESMPTTIQIDHETKEKIKTFGLKGETYQEIINRLYNIAIKDQLHQLLMSSKNTISLEEVRRRHAARWQK